MSAACRDGREAGERRLRAIGLALTFAFVGLAACSAALAAEATGALAPVAVVPDATPTSLSNAALEEAMNHYETCHWPEAYAVLAALADRGNERASRLALLMARHGPQLYGMAFPVSALQAATWSRQALSRAGRAEEF